ncbi:MAG: carboxypeptidase-like regulatory domain-containing protein [Bacteroidales bacterium]|nr:carboxypeptidase-like regulatory domain-containing protein [Bacteroidales bacterium]
MQNTIKTFLVLFILLFMSAHSFAENDSFKDESKSNSTVSLTGIVKDNDTGEELVCAAIEITELKRKVFTDITGRFTITNLNPGNYTLRISYIAYAEKEIKKISASTQQDDLIIQLKQL